MTVVQAFTYVFSDRNWRGKLLETAVFVLLLPFPVIGIVSLCVLLGYLAGIIRNVSSGFKTPLPEWDHIGEDISKGIPVLLAIIVYHLPLLLAAALLQVPRHSLSPGFLEGLSSAAPFLLFVYAAAAWSLLTLGLLRYAETWESDSFYQFDRNLRILQQNVPLALEWLLLSLIANVILLALLPLALLGAFLFVPVQGYLAGSYALRLREARHANPPSHAADPAGLAQNRRGVEATV